MTELALTGGPSPLAWTAAWLLTYLAHGTLLLAGAWGAGCLVSSPAVREVLWKAATVGPLLTATASLALQARGAPGAGAAAWVAGAPPLLRLPAAAVVGAWLATALWGLWQLERGRRCYWRAVGRRETLTDPEAAATLRRLQDAAGCARTVYLTTSDGIGAPAAIGTAEICLPAESFAVLSPAQREGVLAHELGHLLRRDPLWRFAVELLCALFVAQPLLRLARRELRDCAEMLADDFAIRLTGRRRPLVESLTLLAAALRPTHAAATAFGEGHSPLVRRAARLLDAGRRPARPLGRAASGCLAAGLLLPAVAFAPAVAAPRPVPAAAVEFVKLMDVEPGAGGEPALRREVVARRTPGGETYRRYTENGVATEPDASARRWIADVLSRHPLP